MTLPPNYIHEQGNVSGTNSQEHSLSSPPEEEFIVTNCTQESGQLMVKAKVAPDKSQWNPRRVGLGSLVAAQRLQADDTFNSALQFILFIYSPPVTPTRLRGRVSLPKWLHLGT